MLLEWDTTHVEAVNMTKLPLLDVTKMIVHDPLSKGKQPAFRVAGKINTPVPQYNETQESTAQSNGDNIYDFIQAHF